MQPQLHEAVRPRTGPGRHRLRRQRPPSVDAPDLTIVETKEAWVTIDGAISEGLFDVDHMPLRMDGLTVTDPDGVTAPAPAATDGQVPLQRRPALPKDGTYRIALVKQQRHGQLQAEWRDEALPRHRADFAAKEVPAGATEVQDHHHGPAPGHLRHRQQAELRGALKPTGAGLELVPVTHPNDLRAGETMRLRFQLDGKPLPNFPFSLVPGGVKYRGTLGEMRLTTDAKGEASFTLPAPNMYWLSAATRPIPRGRGRTTARPTPSATLLGHARRSCRSKLPACAPSSFPAEIDPAAAPGSAVCTAWAGVTMGTSWSARCCCRPARRDQRSASTAAAELDEIVAQMSHWDGSSELARYNRAPAGSWHALPPQFSP
jgi:hypothetical protein